MANTRNQNSRRKTSTRTGNAKQDPRAHSGHPCFALGCPPRVTPRRALALHLSRNVGRYAVGLGTIYLILGINYAIFFPADVAASVSKLVLGASIACFLLAVPPLKRDVSGPAAEILTLLIGALGIFGATVPLYSVPQPKYTINLIVQILGFSLFGLRLWLFLILDCFAVLAWAVVVRPYFSDAWLPQAAILLGSAALSLLVNSYRARAIVHNEKLRAENEWRREGLALALEALRQSEERFRRLAGAAFEAIAIHESGKILDANPAFATTFGYNPDRVKGQSIHRFIRCSDDRILNALYRGAATTVEALGLHSSGRSFPIEVRVKPIPFGDGQARVVAIRDVSERKRTEEELLRAKEAAEKASEMKSKWLANVSHELRTPLNSIIGFSEMLADEYFGPLNEKQKRYVDNILASGRHLLQLINDLLDLSKIEAGRMELEITEFDPRHVIRNVVETLAPVAFKKQIELVTRFSDCPRTIHADQGKFRQILYNLLSNAIKFTHEGGKVTVVAGLEKRGSETYYHDEPLLKVSVHDTGIGISPEDQKKIFREFEQLPNTYQSQYKGTGLGLPLARKLATLHGGTLWVESQGLGKGSTFAFVIPVRPRDISDRRLERAEGPLSPGAAPPPPRRSSGRPKVLVVDDDAENRELLHDALSSAGYRVQVEADPAKVLDLARTEQPDVITLDVLFSRSEEGWKVLSRLKADPKTNDIPVIVISVLEKKKLALSLGAVAYFRKPVNMQDLIRTLTQITGSKRSPKGKVLIAHSNAEVLERLAENLSKAGFSVLKANDGMQALKLAQRERPLAAVLSSSLPKVSGTQLIQYLGRYPQTKCIRPFLLLDSELPEAIRRELPEHSKLVDVKVPSYGSPEWCGEAASQVLRELAAPATSRAGV